MTDPTQDRAWLAQAIECLRYIGTRYGLPRSFVPPVDSWAHLRAELASRNLGLIPSAEASRFHWPGFWLAGLTDGEQRSAAVMFGSPPAVVWPTSAHGEIEVGFVLAPFDPSLPLLDPYGSERAYGQCGRVVGLYLASEARAPMRPANEAQLIAGRGIEGDRYATGGGTFSGPTGHEITLVAIDGLRDLTEVAVGELRRNIVTRGIDLNRLVDRRFRVGEAVLIGRRLCEPCRHLEELTGARLVTPLLHRAGLRADILHGGSVVVGDEVVIELDNEATLAPGVTP